MQDRAQTVIVGAGIVGTSAAYHLAELGQADVLVIDQRTALRDGRVDLARARAGLPDERVADDVPDRTGFRRACTPSLDVDGEPCWYGVGGIEVATSRSADGRS